MNAAILPTHARVEAIKKIFHGFSPTMTTSAGEIPLIFTLEGIISRCVNIAGTRLEFRESDMKQQMQEFDNFLNTLNGVTSSEKNAFKHTTMLLISDIIQLYTTLNLYSDDGTAPYRYFGFESLTSLNVKVVT